MTLEEFERRLRNLPQYQGSEAQKQDIAQNRHVINQKGDMSPFISNNKENITPQTNFINNTKKQNQNIFQKAGNWFGNIFQGAQNWKDGYDFGDVAKTVLGSTADAGLNVYNAVTSMMEGFPKLAGLGIAQVADWTGNDKFADAMRKEVANPNNDAYLSPKVNAFREKYIEPYSVLGTSSDQVASGIGSTIGAGALSVLGGADVGKLHNIPVGMGIAEAGNSVAENYSKEDVTDAQAWLNGTGKGITSAITESIFGVFGVGGSELDDVLLKGATKKLNSQLAKSMAQLGIKGGGEAAEEFLEYAGGYLTNLATDAISKGKGAEFYEKWNNEEVINNMLSAFVSTGITQSAGNISNIAKGNDVISGRNLDVQKLIDANVNEDIENRTNNGEKVGIKDRFQLEDKYAELLKDVTPDSAKKINGTIQNTKQISDFNLLKSTNSKVTNAEVKNQLKSQIEGIKGIDNDSKKIITDRISMIKSDTDMVKVANDVNELVNLYSNQSNNMSPTSKNVSIKENYNKYKNANLNSEVISNAMELVPSNKQNKRTKEQWLKVAEQIGNNVSPEEAEMYAYKTWMDIKPNNKNNLNRQSKSYVPFTVQEWVNTVKEANTNAQNTNIQNNTLNNQTQVIPSPMQNVNIQQQDTSNLNYEESAQKYNIDTKNATVRSIYDVANKRGLNVRYDNTIFSDNNQNAIWKVNEDGTREVVLNPNADTNKALQSVMIHELTHDIEGTLEYKALSDLVLDYSKSLEDYEKSRKDLENMYSKVYDKNSENFESLVDQEVVADVLGEKLGNQEFVDSLVNQNRNVAQKIYDWVISKLNSFTRAIGFNSEYLYWKDVENKFRKAFNSEFNNTNSNIKYSVQVDENGNKYIKVDTDQDIFEGIAPKDYNKIAKMYMQDYLLGETSLSNTDMAVIDKKSINKYTNPGKKQQNFDKKMQLTPELKNVLSIAQKESIALPNKTNSKYSSWEYYKFNFEISGKTFEGTINIGVDGKGNKHFYEINKIKEANDILGTSLNRSSASSINNIIPSEQNYVNNSQNSKFSISSISQTDNKGRQLSPQQQEAYKNVSEKLKTKTGELKTYYHGTQRADRVGNIFDPKKATSGPMAFFTDNEEIAKSYSENKQDTSISREFDTEYDLFKVDGKSLDDYWSSLTREQKNRIAQEGYNIGLDEDYENIVHEKDASKNSFSNQYDYYLNYEEKGNAIKALYDVFIQDGNLMFEDMQKFQDVLKYAGIDNVTYLDQYKTDSKVYEVYLNITNPFDTSEVTQENINELKRLAMKAPVSQAYNADQWDKTNIKPSDWISRLEEDYKNGTSHAWTSIPDFVTNYLKSKGYDGIVDTGGKNGGVEHQVVIPFYSNQIKNVDNINPTSNDDIRYSQNSDNEWQNFLSKNFKNNGTKETLKDVKFAPTKEDLQKNNRNISYVSDEIQLKNDIENFSKQVDSVKNGTYPKNDMLTLLSKTPQPLLDIGLDNLPITMTQRHLDTIMNKNGKYKNANYHDLGEDIVKQLPEAINNPLDIVQSNTDSNSIVLTTYLADKQNRTVIASIKIDGKGQINNIEIDTNVMTSAYGRKNYDKFMQDNIRNGNLLYDIDRGVIKKATMARLQLPRHSSYVDAVDNASTINNIIPSEQNYVNNEQKSIKMSLSKTINPIEIANLTEEDASSTPKLPNKNYKKGDKESSFYKNITNNSKFLNENLRNELKTEEDIKYYKSVTNEESLAEALKRLDEDGATETNRWFSKKDKYTASDVAEGYILLKRYQDAGKYNDVVEVAKKMRDIGTTAGQTIQAFNILNRLTPEGMTVYAQSELTEIFEEFKKNKTQDWINENESNFTLTEEEQEFIKSKVKEASEYDEHSYERRVALAEIQKMLEDKIPTTLGKEVKAWMRISMLFNPKTQVRNVMGNAFIVPVNTVGDIFATGMDKYLSKFTGIRTTGNVNVKSLIKGTIKGAYESTNDYKKGINTKNMDGNRFEINQGKSFTEKTLVGKGLNRIENLLNYVMDFGDRIFSEAWFENSIANQLKLNNTTEITQEMIDIATEEALSRTWNDNNKYTEFVLGIRKSLNDALNINGYGLGDVLIPFAKTPANLTKAIVDYSPVGLVKSIVEGNNLKNAISRGDMTAQQQHKFVQDLGKATAGSILYILGYALAKAGITTGESDEDKDAKNFIQKTLGISSYSINIGGKSFTYDWAQPLAAPLSITANMVNSKNKEKALYEAIISNLDTAGSILLEQSFLSSLNDVLTNNDGVVSGMLTEILELPSRAIPTLMKQIADMTDGTQRQTFVKDSPIESAKNQMLVKIPGASKMLAPTIDTMGNEVKKYGGKNNIFNVFFNPANVNSSNISKSGKEIYNVYQKTGDKTILPRTATYSLTFSGENYNLSNEEKAKYQTTMGKYVDDNVSKLLNNKSYKQLTDTEKAKIINEIVSDSNEIAKLEYAKEHKLEYERTSTDVKVDDEITKGLDTANAYIYKTIVSKKDGDKDSEGKTINGSTTKNKVKYIMNMQIDDNQKQHLVNLLADQTDYNISVKDLKMLNGNYLTYIQQSGKNSNGKDISPRQEYMNYVKSGINVTELNKFYDKKGDLVALKDENGKSISGSKKQLTFMYVNSLKLSIPQKMILLASQYESFGKTYYKQILEYLNTLNLSNEDKSNIIKTVLL